MPRRLPLVVLVVLAALELASSRAAEPPAAEIAQRTLRFPADRGVGMVFTRPKPQDGYLENNYDDWRLIGHARGEIKAAADLDVRLDVGQAAGADLSFLAGLQPEDLQMLSLRDSTAGDEQLTHVGRLSGLRILDLHKTPITDAGIEHLRGLKRLQVIKLSAFRVAKKGFGVGDGAMAVLADLPEIQSIAGRLTKVTDLGLEHLRRAESLRSLDLSGTQVSDAGMKHLADLPNLEHLSLSVYDEGANITDEGLRTVGQLKRLKTLSLSGTKITDDGLHYLSGLTSLEDLNIDKTKVTQAGLVHLKPLTALRDLRFYQTINDEGAANLAQLKSLRKLTSNLDVTDKGLAELVKLPHLESLSVGGDGVTDAGLEHIARMTSLKHLEFQNCPITDKGLEKLVTLTNLEYLLLSGTRVSGDGLATLTKLPKLNSLSLNFGKSYQDYHGDRPHLKHVGALEQLKTLTLDGGRLASEDLSELQELVNVRELTVSGWPVTDEGAMYLGGLISLTSLTIEDGALSDFGLKHLGNLRRLEYLDLSGHFTDDGLDRLKRMTSLSQVRLASPYLTDDAMKHLAAAMPSVTTAKRNYYRSLDFISYGDADMFRRRGKMENRADLNALELKAPPKLEVENWLNADGDGPTLDSLRGKVVLVDFWGTWCGPCRAAMPKLKRLHEKYKDRGLVILSIHTTTAADAMAPYVNEEKLPWAFASDVEERSANAWHVPAYPALYLVDRQGQLRVAALYEGDIKRAVLTLLDEPATPAAAVTQAP